jgi:hypothetical protein
LSLAAEVLTAMARETQPWNVKTELVYSVKGNVMGKGCNEGFFSESVSVYIPIK